MGSHDRALLMFRSIRCLDCEPHNSSIEFVQSPVSQEQRSLVRKLMRDGHTNQRIYRHLCTLYGTHIVLEQRDQLKLRNETDFILYGQVVLAAGFGLFSALLIRRLLRRKK